MRFGLALIITLAGCAMPDAPPAGDAPAPLAPVGKADGAAARSPWGGADPDRWTPEAILANAAQAALARAWTAGVADVVVATPVSMSTSAFSPFGDGQTNAGATLGTWSASRPPLVATLTTADDGARALRLVFDRALPTRADAVTLWTDALGEARPWALAGRRDARGDLTIEWPVPAGVDLGEGLGDGLALVRLDDWADAFPLRFTHPVHPAESLADTDPRGPLPLPDPAGVGADDAFAALMAGRAGPGYNAAPYRPTQVHAAVAGRQTAVGGAHVWVAEPPAAPLKHVYLCLDARDEAAEAATGAPSGSGWHAIGDPAESLVNSLARGPLLTGWAAARPFGGHPLAHGGGLAYGLTDVATFRRLQPGEALVTGNVRHPAPPVFHWFAVDAATPTCAEIWVHPCPPDADLTLACRALPAQLVVDAAPTRAGEVLRVVGAGPALGDWDPARGVPMSRLEGDTWLANVPLSPGEAATFKFVKVGPEGVTWERGSDRTWTVPVAGMRQYRAAFAD